MTISGSTFVCPGTTREYTVTGGTSVIRITVWLGNYSLGNAQYLTDRIVNEGMPFNVNFPAYYQGTVTITVKSWYGFEGNPVGSLDAGIYISARVPSPARPNGGLIVACQAGERVALSSLPALMNGPNDCYFHCTLEWAAPNGWNFEYSALNNNYSGNPLGGPFDNINLVVPSGLSTGGVGQVSATAYYSLCSSPLNTSSTAAIWYGTSSVVVGGATVNGSPYQGGLTYVPYGYASMVATSQGNAATSWIWEISHGSGTLSPSGNSYAVSTSDFARVVARPINRCGEGDPYVFYIQNDSSSGYRTAPNPASDKMTVQFDYPEMTEAVTSVVLYDEKGKAVRNFDVEKARQAKQFDSKKSIELDVKSLPRGIYFFHVNYGSSVNKSQVVLN